MNVLLVDDDPFTLVVLGEMLDALGQFRVTAEGDAKRALAVLEALVPELLICDLSMPDMDGIEFLQAAAEQGYGGQVILLSGVNEGVLRAAERLARANGLRIVDAFRKPLSMEQMRVALERAARVR